MGFFIPAEREHHLRDYKYSGHDGSLLSRYILTPYWNNLVKIFPMWYAPNLITLSGLAFVFVNFITMIYWEPLLACAPKPIHKVLGGSWDPLFGDGYPVQTAVKSVAESFRSLWHGATFDAANKFCPPGWLFYSWGISLFIYQSLDAIDGKQARRTGASSPLGEVFDHGCDAINTTLEVLLTAAALNLGQGWWTVVSQFFTLANFYLTTWEEFHTGTLYLSAFSGPVEGILLVCIIYCITGYYGPEFWDVGIFTFLRIDHQPIIKTLHLKNLPLNECFLTFGFFALLFNIAGSYTNVYKARAKKGEDVFAPILGLLPFAINAGLNVFWLAGNEYIRTQHLLPFSLFWGLSFAYQVGLLITAHVSKGPFPYYNLLMIWSAIGAVDANATKLFGRPTNFIQTSESASLTFVYVSLIISFGVYCFFVSDTISTFCRVLDINCLTIKYYGKPKPSTSFEKEPQIPDRNMADDKTAQKGLRQRK